MPNNGHHLHSRRRRCSGFTLIEALIASVVLAIGVLGIGVTLAASSVQSDATGEATTSAALGRQLLEEVAARPFPISGQTTGSGYASGNRDRSTYDDVSDYSGYTDASPFTTLAGTTISTSGTYQRTVSFARRLTPTGTASASGNFGLVTVIITAPSGTSWRYSLIVSAFTQSRS